MEALLPLIIQAVGGIAGGYGASSVLKQLGIGMLTKVLGGAVGGVGLGNILGAVLANPGAASSLSGILTNGVGGAAGGAVLTSIIGLVMKSMNKA